MLGLRTRESDKFNRYFDLIQKEAASVNAAFFADAGDGNDFETPEMEGEIMMGWLIPKERMQEFLPIWEKDAVDDSWTDFFKWAVWRRTEDLIKVHFED